jgi:protein-disulfide isomerase
VSSRVRDKHANRAAREQLAAEQARRDRRLWVSVAALVVLLVAGLIGWSVWRSQRPESVAAPAGATDDGGTRAGITVAGDGPVPVEVYLDFLCPACKRFEDALTPTLDQLIEEKKIRLVWHPLGFLDDLSSPSGYSTRAASAAGCAADGSKIKAYGEALFANQPPEGSAGLSDDQLVDLGGTVGLIAPSFAACVRDTNYRDWVAHVNDTAARRGVNQTPTVYVADNLIAEPTADAIVAAVNAAS